MSLNYPLNGWNGKFCFAYSSPIKIFFNTVSVLCSSTCTALLNLLQPQWSFPSLYRWIEVLRSCAICQRSQILYTTQQNSNLYLLRPSPVLSHYTRTASQMDIMWRDGARREGYKKGKERGEKKMEGDLNSMTTAIIRSLKLYKNKMSLHVAWL